MAEQLQSLTDDEIETIWLTAAHPRVPPRGLVTSQHADDEGDTPDDDGSYDDEAPVDSADDDGTGDD